MSPTWAELWRRVWWLAYHQFRAIRKARRRKRIARLQAKRARTIGATIGKIAKQLKGAVAKPERYWYFDPSTQQGFYSPAATLNLTTNDGFASSGLNDAHPPRVLKTWDQTFDSVWTEGEGDAA